MSKVPPIVHRQRRDDIANQLPRLEGEAAELRVTVNAMKGTLGSEPSIGENEDGTPLTVTSLMTEGSSGQVSRPQVEAALATSSLPRSVPQEVVNEMLAESEARGLTRTKLEAALNAAVLPAEMPQDFLKEQAHAPFAKPQGYTQATNVATAKALASGILFRDKLQGGQTEVRLKEALDAISPQIPGAPSSKGQVFGRRLAVSKADTAFDHKDNAARIKLCDAIARWLLGPFKLEQPHRAAHKGLASTGLHITTYRDNEAVESKPLAEHPIQIVMVEHDWASVFKSASFEGSGSGEWHLPFDAQIFEFAISGACVLACMFTAADEKTTMTLSIRPPGEQAWCCDQTSAQLRYDGWDYIGRTELVDRGPPEVNAGFHRLYDFIFAQIRAVAIMLEAEVAETEPVRAPYKTNREPKDRKPLPALSHHIVRLNRKARPVALPEAERTTGTKKRLHFRRGHWRHYANHKTWIKWCLVGNPDLGFVDKDYRT